MYQCLIAFLFVVTIWKLNFFWKEKIQLCLWDSNWVSSLVFSSKGFCRSSYAYHDHAQFYNTYYLLFFLGDMDEVTSLLLVRTG